MGKLFDADGTDAMWIGACAHQLQRRLRTVGLDELKTRVVELWRNEHLRSLTPAAE